MGWGVAVTVGLVSYRDGGKVSRNTYKVGTMAEFEIRLIIGNEYRVIIDAADSDTAEDIAQEWSGDIGDLVDGVTAATDDGVTRVILETLKVSPRNSFCLTCGAGVGEPCKVNGVQSETLHHVGR